MKQTFKPSPLRCFMAIIFSLFLAGLATFFLMQPNLEWLDIVMSGFILLLGVACAIANGYFMLSDTPIYLLNERGLTVRQGIWQRSHFRLNWHDIEKIYISADRAESLRLKIKDSSRQYFDEAMQQKQSKRMKIDRTMEILGSAWLVEGGKKAVYHALLEYWQQYR
ncbi:hypothetical protein ACKLNO_03195 [Neisseriaceae bacterium B1]